MAVKRSDMKALRTITRTMALLLALSPGCYAQVTAHPSPYSNSVLPAQRFTASSQMGTVIPLSGSSSLTGGSFASGTVTLTGTSLTTVSFAVLGSSGLGSAATEPSTFFFSSLVASPTVGGTCFAHHVA